MIGTIKKWSFRKKLNEAAKRGRNSSKSAINPGKKIGIFYRHTNKSDEMTIRKIKDQFISNGKIVSTLAFVEEEIPVNRLGFKAYSKEHIQWDNSPVSPAIDDFMSRNYDVLICPIYPIEAHQAFIINSVQAPLKIGILDTHAQKLYDFIIDSNYRKNLAKFMEDILAQIKFISLR